jgi:hypothetical protein
MDKVQKPNNPEHFNSVNYMILVCIFRFKVIIYIDKTNIFGCKLEQRIHDCGQFWESPCSCPSTMQHHTKQYTELQREVR